MNRLHLVATLFLALGAACSSAPRHSAEVKLTIDGQAHDYHTASAQLDFSAGVDRPSVYLLRDDGQSGATLSLRRYQGQPAARLWLQHRVGDQVQRYDCYVPGLRADGSSSLDWKKADGSPRERTETGEAGCQAELTREDGRLRLSVDAAVHLASSSAKGKKPAGSDDAKGRGDRTGGLKIQATATVHLDGKR